MGDLKLESGEVIKDFAISYVTHGTLNAKKWNAILMVTALTGNHHRLDFLIWPGKALDTSRYFVVATDAIGTGLTTSPRNRRAQPQGDHARSRVEQRQLHEHPGGGRAPLARHRRLRRRAEPRVVSRAVSAAPRRAAMAESPGRREPQHLRSERLHLSILGLREPRRRRHARDERRLCPSAGLHQGPDPHHDGRQRPAES